MAYKKKVQVWLPLLLSLCIVAGMFVGYRLRGNMPAKNMFFVEKPKPVQEVLDLISRKYVDSVNVDSLGNAAIMTILSGLDPHSVYIPARKLVEVNEELEGVFFGIGIEFVIIKDTSTVLRILEGGPAASAGLRPGDKIIKINDSLIAGNHSSSETMRELTRGKKGTPVKLRLMRGSKIVDLEVKRGPVKITSIDAFYMADDTTGFIRINKFSENTYKEFMKAMDTLNARGMKALILDLRDNGGGVLTEAIYIADEFLDGNKLITYTEGVHSPKREYRCDKEGVFEKGRLVVIVNEGTASASEVLAGALQDWDRAEIIGRRTFGKGLVQEQYELSDRSGLRLTVARYFTPLGRSIQRSYQNGSEAYYHDIIDRFKHGEMESADSIRHDGQKEFRTSSGRILYSGGGITPDIFISVDTANFEKPIMKALMSGALNRFVNDNFLKNQSRFTGINTIRDFKEKFIVNDTILKEFNEFAVKDSVFVNLKNANQKEQLENQIRMLTARVLFGTEGFFEIKNPSDSMFTKSMEAIRARNFR